MAQCAEFELQCYLKALWPEFNSQDIHKCICVGAHVWKSKDNWQEYSLFDHVSQGSNSGCQV